MWREGLAWSVLSVDYQRILEALADRARLHQGPLTCQELAVNSQSLHVSAPLLPPPYGLLHMWCISAVGGAHRGTRDAVLITSLSTRGCWCEARRPLTSRDGLFLLARERDGVSLRVEKVCLV